LGIFLAKHSLSSYFLGWKKLGNKLFIGKSRFSKFFPGKRENLGRAVVFKLPIAIGVINGYLRSSLIGHAAGTPLERRVRN
jgi:hypothetical protein